MLNDIRYALRLIQRTPIASVVAILTVAIGVGANTAIFSVIRAVLLKPSRSPTLIVSSRLTNRGRRCPARVPSRG
jgi:hypothetical protein